MTSIQPEFKKLPGSYKGTRRRREPPIAAECPCGWRSRPTNPEKAEKRFAAHVAVVRAPIATLFLLAGIFFPSPARAQNHPAAISGGSITSINSQSFTSGSGIVLPAANQLMVFLVSGPPGQTLLSIADTYGLGGTCSGTPPVCGSWKQFQNSGLHSNANLGFSSALMTGYYAPTGTHSGAETVTLTWSSGGTTRLFPLMSFSSADVNVSSPEDSSGFHEDTNANSCTSPSPVGPTLNISNSADVVASLIDFNTIYDTPNSPSSSGPTQRTIIDTRGWTYASLTGWNGITGTLATVPTGSQSTTWGWGSCVSTAGNAGVFQVALKSGSSATHPVRHRVIQGAILPIWLRRKELAANGR